MENEIEETKAVDERGEIESICEPKEAGDDIRIGSVIELEDGNAYKVVSAKRGNTYHEDVRLNLKQTCTKPMIRVTFLDIVRCYGKEFEVTSVSPKDGPYGCDLCLGKVGK